MSKTGLRDHSIEAWRWNVNQSWAHFSSMIEDDYMSRNASTTFERHKSSKSCLYFAVAAVESFINQELRIFLECKGIENEKICKILEGGKEKIKFLKQTQFGVLHSDEYYKKYEYYKEIRNEVTHPIRKDQLISDYLNIVETGEIVNIVKYIFVKICELQNKEFQYWMLGWNYVGFNFNDFEPFLSNNLNGFYHSMVNMGIPGFDYGFQMSFCDTYMKTYEHFKVMEKLLFDFPFEIEFQMQIFPSKPRLTRKWWDKSVLTPDTWLSCKDDPNNIGWKLGWAVLSRAGTHCLGVFDTKEKAIYIQLINNATYYMSYARVNIETNEVKPINTENESVPH